MATTKARVVRGIVGVVLAIGLSGFVYPAGPIAVISGFLVGIGEFIGPSTPEPLVGTTFMLAGLVLTVAPFVLAVLVIRPPRTARGWVAGGVLLVLTGIFIHYGVQNGWIGGWFQSAL